MKMSIAKVVFEVNASSFITVHKTILKRLRSIKDLLTPYEEFLTFCDDIIITEQAILMIDRIQRKMNIIKEDKDMLLYYHNLRIFCMNTGTWIHSTQEKN